MTKTHSPPRGPSAGGRASTAASGGSRGASGRPRSARPSRAAAARDLRGAAAKLNFPASASAANTRAGKRRAVANNKAAAYVHVVHLVDDEEGVNRAASTAEKEASSCDSALPDFSDDGVAHPINLSDDIDRSEERCVELCGGAPTKRLRCEAEEKEGPSPAAPPEDLLFDDPFAFGEHLGVFNGGEYEAASEGLFVGDNAVQQWGDSMGLWSFDDDCLVDDNVVCC
jgi:EREBP-like factor